VTDRLKAAAARVGQARILFAHQSVGANILDGMRDLENESGASIPIAAFEASRQWAGIASARVGRNGDPRSKTAAFAAAVAQSSPSIALHKYCYVDLHRDGDAAGLFDFYRAQVTALAQASPATTVLHVTMPLMTADEGVTSAIKRWLGRSRDRAADNAVREKFNSLMRAAFPADAILDLAALESSVEPRALRADFTTDGGHLNDLGRQVVAAAFLEFLSAAVYLGPSRS
jgi:hypothetical protein